jgi:lipopolysaccharide transport system permease protein
LGARFKDIYQLVPVVLQLIFLLSPILYMKESLGHYAWIAHFNPLYQAFSPLRDSLIQATFNWPANLTLLVFNVIGTVISLGLLQRERRVLPFLV